MAEQPQLKASKGRKNSRTGCAVCRVRHIKCGEEKPSCLRCQAAKWVCEYSEPVAPERRSSPPIAAGQPSLEIYQLTNKVSDNIEEQRSHHYFQLCMSQDVFNGNPSDTWYDLVLRSGQTVPAVRHAVFAIGFLLRASSKPVIAQSSSGASDGITEGLERAALVHYTRAMAMLTAEPTGSQASETAALIICPLFIWIEMLNKRLGVALHHLKGGLAILESQQPKPNREVASCLRDLYARLHAQARLYGSPDSDFNAPGIDRRSGDQLVASPTTSFATVTAARVCLDRISEALYLEVRRFHVSSGTSKIDRSDVSSPAKETRLIVEGLQTNLEEWDSRFVALTRGASARRGQTLAEAMLKLHRLNLEVFIAGVLSDNEMVYDMYAATFECMLSLADQILGTGRDTGLAMLPLDPGVIAPLAVIALKCRDTVLRRRAMSLLALAPEQECMWRRDSVIAFGNWKLSKEEGQQSENAVQLVGNLRAKPAPVSEGMRTHSEKGSVCMVGGRPVTVVRFKVGGGGSLAFKSEIRMNLPVDMGDIL
ncbi:hypothetical protein LTR56_021935 [Elasticomyces elasticus]|nr:hypothetical protein LTR56_021935 [Elasticomyces elasticus]KAK3643524.1 hypothetical protein LTR22_015627 [Elasticomyces elasticus]KAK4915032.1 hypothetical protein LTR49_016781 [Elasticomyces elasticus]KAK5751117.1 hypothetical protein LTS12_018840 [Elasticomyces elasticus]